jgi:hypothetical protein
MEQVLRGLQHILIYIDDELIHTDTHEKHLEALEQVLMRLHQHHLKINLDKCLFGDQQVSYLGFTLTPEGIKPGEAKQKVIKNVAPPKDNKEFDLSWDSATFSGTISKISQSLQPLCLNSRGKIPDTNPDLYQTLLWRHSRHSKPNCPSNQHSLFPEPTGTTC